jgi:hypothetical protein
MTLGFIALSLGYGAWIASRTVLDTGATEAAARRIVTLPAVQKSLEEKFDGAIAQSFERTQLDPQVKSAARLAAADPRIVNAFVTAVGALHHALLTDAKATIVLDPRAVSGALHDALVSTDPQLANQIAHGSPMRISVDAGKLPHLDKARDTDREAMTLGLAAGLLLVAISLMQVRDSKAISRLGRRIAYLAIGPVLVFAVIPHLLDGWHNTGTLVAGALLRSYSGRVLPSAILLVVAGCSVFLVALARRVFRTDQSPAPVLGAPPARTPNPPSVATPAAQPSVPDRLYL